MTASAHARYLAKGGFTLTGSGSLPAVEAYGRSCRYLRHFVRASSQGVFDNANTLGHVRWAQAHGMKVHSVVGDVKPAYMAGFSQSTFQQFVSDWLLTLYNLGERVARIEVGNELNIAPNWIASAGGDAAFNQYMRMYTAASDAMRAFRTAYPDAQFLIGGPACSTGGSFAFRVAQRSIQQGLLLDFVSWHWYGYSMSFESLRTDIVAIKAAFGLPVILTEVGYDPWGPLNNSQDAAKCLRDFFINGKELGVDDVLFLSSYATDGSGIWTDANATALSPMGEVVMDFLA